MKAKIGFSRAIETMLAKIETQMRMESVFHPSLSLSLSFFWVVQAQTLNKQKPK